MGTERTAADVFGLLSDGIRLDVLRAVALAQDERRQTGVTALSFSDIYERVDVDNTSKLSYHLGELTGTFLRKHGDGYAFTHAGEQLVRFVLAENYRSPSAFDPIETAGSCLRCGETALEAALHDQFFLVQCSACGQPAFSYRIRPAQVRSNDGTDLIDAVIWELAGDFLKMRQGVCPDCAGRLDTAVVDIAEQPVPDELPASFGTVSECRECLRFLSLPLTHAAAYHPESVTFHWERGVDIAGTAVWEFHRFLDDGRWTAERVGTDPDEYRVDLRHENSSLRLYLDDEATVTRTERVRRGTEGDRRS